MIKDWLKHLECISVSANLFIPGIQLQLMWFLILKTDSVVLIIAAIVCFSNDFIATFHHSVILNDSTCCMEDLKFQNKTKTVEFQD